MSGIFGGNNKGSFGPMSGKSNPGSWQWQKDWGKTKPKDRTKDSKRPG